MKMGEMTVNNEHENICKEMVPAYPTVL